MNAAFLTPFQWTWALGAVFCAGALRGFTGFGFAVAAVPLASLVLEPRTAVVSTLLMQTAIGLRDCVVERRRADWRAIAWLAIGGVVGTPLGVLGLTVLPVPWVRLGLGLMVLGAMAITWRPPRLQRRLGRHWAILAGFASGMSNGLAAMSGPPAIVFFLATEPDRARARGSLLSFFPIAAAIALVPAFRGGLVLRDDLLIAAFGLPLMLLGGTIGAALFRRYGQRAYRPVAAISLGLTAAAAILRGLAGLLP